MKKDGIGNTIVKLKEIDSTNNYASTLIEEETAENGLIITAQYQNQGRGQRENKWESKSGKNLLLSLAIFPDFIPIEKQFIISKAISLAIADTLSKYTDDIKIKWPNDIYFRDKKIAGILIENVIMGSNLSQCIAGMGININQKRFSPTLPNPVSLSQIINQELNTDKILEELITHLNHRYDQLKSGFIKDINEEYLQRLYLLNIPHSYTARNNVFVGKILGVSEQGKLIIQTEPGQNLEFNFKEVEF